MYIIRMIYVRVSGHGFVTVRRNIDRTRVLFFFLVVFQAIRRNRTYAQELSLPTH